MKAASFDFIKASSLDDVFDAFDQYGDDAVIIAGGQSLMPALNMRLSAPSHLIDIGSVPGLGEILVTGGSLRIGALARHREVASSPEVAAHAPLIAKAMPLIAHAAIRNRGTFGGSLANADPASELPACTLALGATFNIAGRGGTRQVAASDFFQGLYETAIGEGEVLVGVDIPVIQDGEKAAFSELVRRSGDYATVGVAAQAQVTGKALSNVRLAFFAVADRPLLAAAAAAAIEGRACTAEVIKAAQDDLGRDLAGIAGDVHTEAATKLHLARVLLGRALNELTGEAA
ncbi:MAG: xanthine dehydrogenase family protein subunit M [Rhodospirillales bacterium]|nr:xanthine dehydrogenase family protein subunit M [Rhodospirillales bacterium]